jgi:hypothetical protein
MESDWKCIYSSGDVNEVIILKGLLESEEIQCVMINKKDSAYLVGEAELYVKTEDVLTAKRIISKTEC